LYFRKNNVFEEGKDLNCDLPESLLYQELVQLEKTLDNTFSQRMRDVLSFSRLSLVKIFNIMDFCLKIERIIDHQSILYKYIVKVTSIIYIILFLIKFF
jgi:hypothetical protein